MRSTVAIGVALIVAAAAYYVTLSVRAPRRESVVPAEHVAIESEDKATSKPGSTTQHGESLPLPDGNLVALSSPLALRDLLDSGLSRRELVQALAGIRSEEAAHLLVRLFVELSNPGDLDRENLSIRGEIVAAIAAYGGEFAFDLLLQLAETNTLSLEDQLAANEVAMHLGLTVMKHPELLPAAREKFSDSSAPLSQKALVTAMVAYRRDGTVTEFSDVYWGTDDNGLRQHMLANVTTYGDSELVERFLDKGLENGLVDTYLQTVKKAYDRWPEERSKWSERAVSIALSTDRAYEFESAVDILGEIDPIAAIAMHEENANLLSDSEREYLARLVQRLEATDLGSVYEKGN